MYHNPRKLRVKNDFKKLYIEPETGKVQKMGYLAKTFEEIATGISFNVYNTHLKSKKGYELLRENQMKQMLEDVKVSELPTLIMGDWNDTPDSLALSHVIKMEGIISAARIVQHEFTTHKYRHETGMVTRLSDYVYYFP